LRLKNQTADLLFSAECGLEPGRVRRRRERKKPVSIKMKIVFAGVGERLLL